MAQTVSISTKELERVAAAAYVGSIAKVMLCNNGVNGYTADTSLALWQAVELSGNGYVRYTETISVGSYNSVTGVYVLPNIDAEFTSTVNTSFDTIVVYIDGSSYPHSIISEAPNITINAGQTITYRLSIRTDD